MAYAETISTIALCVSVAGFFNSFYGTYRDKAKLKFNTRFIEASENGQGRFYVTVANSGRRPIVLRVKGGSTADNLWSGEFLGEKNAGLRLAEREHHDCNFKKDDVFFFDHISGNVEPYVCLWFEDSLGNRAEIPGSRDAIQRLIA